MPLNLSENDRHLFKFYLSNSSGCFFLVRRYTTINAFYDFMPLSFFHPWYMNEGIWAFITLTVL